jgi:hypothetical protein
MPRGDEENVYSKLSKLGRLYPKPWPLSEHFAPVTKETDDWVRDFKITYSQECYKRYLLVGCGCCASYVYPSASKTVVRLGSDIIAWLFIFDDYFGEAEQLNSSFQQTHFFESFRSVVLDGVCPPGANEFHFSLLDIVNRSAAYFGNAWRTAFCDSLFYYFDGCRKEFEFRKDRKSAKYADYRVYRERSIGVFPTFEFVDCNLVGKDCPGDRVKPHFTRARSLAAIICSEVNDMVSFSKERYDNDPNNLVHVLMNEHKIAADDAFDMAIATHDRDLSDFHSVVSAAQHSEVYGQDEKVYLLRLQDFVLGCYPWHMSSIRYHDENFGYVRFKKKDISGLDPMDQDH